MLKRYSAVIVCKADISWYNYEFKQWANAVVIKNSKKNDYNNKSGKIILEDDILAYFVWIPRFKYKLCNTQGLPLVFFFFLA